ncbi:cytochrome c [Ensifer sp. LCM 4579]|uniref:c-type cytochrome n=1 Tax=Ensifer sp. LCM 4579 TaxID=1848292 RepID=UPI0008D927D1|nr:cytochrome c [Ensifer sp. LCM 4579]OHV83970.1 hypothetical protein LCM4579_15605 [Ensifer sp. LCM 4579]
MNKHPAILGAVGGIVGTILAGIAIWLIVVYTGAYNVAASDQHFDAVRWTFDTTLHRSVAARAGGTGLPENPPESFVAEGAGHYAESCVHCHGAPGREPDEWSRGMQPLPPHLTEAATEWTGEEIHWIVSNGIKSTGMPAYGEHHSAEEINAIATFVAALPGLTADDYARLAGAAQRHAEETPSSAADHGHNGSPVAEP